jgi:hypothetical protein
MHFTFERIVDSQFLNFINCTDVNESNICRFTVSPLTLSILNPSIPSLKNIGTYSDKIIPGSNYIIASGVSHSPPDWCGEPNDSKRSLFYYLNADYLKDLQNNNAFLLLDQSHEGYQTVWLWKWFHDNCITYNINPSRIIYVTGNLNAATQYDMWTRENNQADRILVIPYPHFKEEVRYTANIYAGTLPNFQGHLEYKKNNLRNIKAYNALQKRPRSHRIWLFNYLYFHGLLPHGINTMNIIERSHTYFENRVMDEMEYDLLRPLLPMLPPGEDTVSKFSDASGGEYLNKFNEQIMLDSWVSVISEASFGDSDNTCFISEKTFKAIVCQHPFIIFGNRGSLARLRELGYKTFSPYIDESYDNLPTWKRLSAIVKEIERIKNIPPREKLNWYSKMQDIVEHNYQHINNEVNLFRYINVISDYVKEKNV